MPVQRTEKAALRQTTLAGFTARPSSAVKTKEPRSPAVEDVLPAKSSGKLKQKAVDENRALTDVVLCIKPEFTKLIAERRKNYEYRKYRLKDSVTRLWLYETAPTSAITYVFLYMKGPEPYWTRKTRKN